MSTDIDVITAAGESFHDIWANFVDLPIGIYLLYRQVGNASLLVLIPTVGKSHFISLYSLSAWFFACPNTHL
jgi:hypothetical protein